MSLPPLPRVLARIACSPGLLAAALLGLMGPGTLTLQAQSSGVSKSLFPPVCARLPAQLTTAGEAPESETTFDTERIQLALNRCAAGQAVELGSGTSAQNAFLTGPLQIPAGVTLLLDGGVTLFASRNPADYDLAGLPCGEAACRPLIEAAAGTDTPAAGLMGFGLIDMRGPAPLLRPGQIAQQRWSSFAPSNRPAAIVAHGNFLINAITLRDWPGTAVRSDGPGLQVLGARLSGSASMPASEGIVLAPGSTGAAIVGASISTARYNLLAPPGTLATLEQTALYAGLGWAAERGLTGSAGCVASLTGTLPCVAAALPPNLGELFISTPAAPDSQTLPPGAVFVLSASVVAAEADSPRPQAAVSFFDGDKLLGTAPLVDAVARLALGPLDAGPHRLWASSLDVPSGFGDLVQPASQASASVAPQAAATPALQTVGVSAAVTIAASPGQLPQGAALTLTANDLPPAATGSVTFLDNGAPLMTVPITGTTTPVYWAFGDQITFGLGLSDPSLAYPGQLGQTLGLTFNSHAQPGAISCDLLPEEILPAQIGATLASQPLFSLMTGTLEADAFGPGAHEANFNLCQQATLAWLGTVRENKVLPGDPGAQIVSGGWIFHPGVWDDLFGTLYNSTGSGTVSFQVSTAGAPAYLWYLMSDHLSGSFTLTVDGTATGTSYTTGPATPLGAQGGVGYGLLRLPVAAGVHTLTVTAQSGTVGILGAGSPIGSGASPLVLATDLPAESQAAPLAPASTLATYSADVQSNVQLLRADGLNLQYVATAGFMTGNAAEMLDSLDTTQLGSQHLAQAIEAALAKLPPSPYSSFTASAPTATTTALTMGTHSLTASYSGDRTYLPAVSAVPALVTVTLPAPTSLALSAPTNLAYGTTLTIAASLTPSAATGTVTITDPVLGVLGQMTLAGGSGSLSMPAPLGGGGHSLTATYSGDTMHSASSTGFNLNVMQIQPALVLTPSTTTPVFGTPVSFSVNLAAQGTPAGPPPVVALSAAFNNTTAFLGDSIFAYWTLPVHDYGIQGQTSDLIAARIGSVLADASTQGYQRVILMAGTNDILHTANDPATTVANIASMAQAAAAAGLRPILCTITPIYTADYSARILALNAAIRAYAAQNDFLLIDFYNAVVNHPEDTDDGIHPSPAGYIAFQSEIMQSILFPTGTVSLPDGTAAMLSATGTAILTPSTLSGTLGTAQTITASYSGDASFLPASAATQITVAQAVSATTLSAQPLTGYSGTAAVLTATVSNATGIAATGTVSFQEGAGTVGSAAVSSTGVAVLTTGQLANGPHSFTALYSGDRNFSGSASPAASVSVRYLQTAVSLSVSSTTLLVNSPITLTATLSQAAATGTVSFFQGSFAMGQATVSQGIASLTTIGLFLGQFPITAVYSGDGYDAPATSPGISVQVNSISAILTLGASTASATYGTPVVLSASLQPAGATGVIVFTDTTTAHVLGQAMLAQTAGRTNASLSLSGLSPGSHTIQATYGGDTYHYPATSTAVAVTIQLVPTTTTLGALPATLPYGVPVTVNVQVNPATATGSVRLTDSNGSSLASIPLTNGMASLTTASLQPGLHGITAMYSGDGTDAASVSSTQSLQVTVLPATLVLNAVPASLTIGTPLTLTATLQPASATGQISFRDADSGALGQAALVNGSATLQVNGLAAGPHSFTATYAGDALDSPAGSAAVSTQINLNPSTLTLASSAGTLFFNAPGSLTATLSPAAATGSVSFRDSVSGPLGTALVVNGSASLKLPSLATGTHTLTATYTGDPSDQPAASTPISLTILDGNSTTSLTLAQTSIPAGTPVLLNIRVATTLASVPTGTVTVRAVAGGVPVVLGSATLANGSASQAYATLSLSSSALGLGSFTSVTAFYTGDTADSPSDSTAAPASFAVVANPTTVTLTMPASQLPVATPLQLHASVSAASGVPGGSIQFMANGQALATATLDNTGSATAAIAPMPAGSYALTASYAATGFYGGAASAPQTLIVTPPVSLALTPSTLSVAAAATADATLTVTPLSGFTGSLAATCTAPQTYLTCTLSAPATVNGGPVAVAVHIAVQPNMPGTTAQLDPPASKLLERSILALALLLPLFTRRRLRQPGLRMLLVIACLAASVAGCGTGGTFGDTPTGSNAVTVTIAAAGVSASSTLTVNIVAAK